MIQGPIQTNFPALMQLEELACDASCSGPPQNKGKFVPFPQGCIVDASELEICLGMGPQAASWIKR